MSDVPDSGIGDGWGNPDAPLPSDHEPEGPPVFVMRGCMVAYNLTAEQDVLFVVDPHGDQRQAVLTLMGWNPATAQISRCIFYRDPTVEPGTMIISPQVSEVPD